MEVMTKLHVVDAFGKQDFNPHSLHRACKGTVLLSKKIESVVTICTLMT